MPLIPIDIYFTVLRPVKSLPLWHGARWNAMLRHVARKAEIPAETAYEMLIPQRQGNRHWHSGEQVSLRLLVKSENITSSLKLINAMRMGHSPDEGEFRLGDSLNLADVVFPLKQPSCIQDDGHHGRSILPLAISREVVQEEVLALQKLQHWSIRLLSPLRLTKPAGGKKDGRYADACFFQQPEALACFFERIRYPLADADLSNLPAITATELQWQDVAYNPVRHMRLGGVMGRMELCGNLDEAAAFALCGGQYTGTGKNARFGFGIYSVSELHCFRRMVLFPQI